ncbi:MAG: DinB family protein [Flavobacteriales bacterium]
MTKPGTSTDLLKTEIVLKNEENLERIKICLDQLNENQIWHRSNSHTNSIANLILHLNGNITQYILSSLGKEPDERQRAVEFSIEKGTNKEELILLISKCISKANQVIRETKEQRLLKEEIVQGFQMTGLSNLVHVCEHLSYHTGQIALLTKIITNQDLRFYDNLDLDQTN